MPCSDVFLETLETFRTQPRATLSFTDAAIVSVARDRRAAVATFDADFRDVEDLAIVSG